MHLKKKKNDTKENIKVLHDKYYYDTRTLMEKTDKLKVYRHICVTESIS